MNWDDAKKYCEKMDRNLVSIASSSEKDLMNKFCGNHGCWTGGYRKSTKGKWYWEDGTPFGYTAWYPGQPNNDDGKKKGLQNKIELMGGTLKFKGGGNVDSKGRWNDARGSVAYYPVCGMLIHFVMA